MSDLAIFAERVDDVLNDSSRIRHWTPEEAGQFMAAYAIRRDRFEQLACRLMRNSVVPRLATVASRFSNSRISDDELPHSITCWFEGCERFPALARIEISIEHDVRFEKLVVHTQTRIMPVFIRFSEQDNLGQSLDSVNEDEVADWVEERLLEFLDTYMRIDAGEEDPAGQVATDPVCGMQIVRADAAATDSYCGHPYFFCSDGCHLKFQEDPTRYVQIKTM